MEIELARETIQRLGIITNAYKTLRGMLEGSESFPQTQEIIIQDIMNSNDLQSLALEYETLLIRPMLANGTSTSASSDSGEKRASRQSVADRVRERDKDCCVLTGKCDFDDDNVRKGFEVAHIVPHRILNNPSSQFFIQRFAPWIPDDFFANLDSCQNAIFLNHTAHKYFGNFKWFIALKENENPANNVYLAMQVAENNALRDDFSGRDPFMEDGRVKYRSSYKQPLFIGNSYPPPAKPYIKLHELLARILYMRGGGEDLIEEEEYDEDSLMQANREPQMGIHEKVAKYMDSMKSKDTILPIDELCL